MLNTSHESALRSLDAAAGVRDADHRRRADELLDRIVSTPVESAPTSRRIRGREVRVCVLALAVVAAIVAVTTPWTSRSSSAYASWVAKPSVVASADLDTVVRACRGQLQRGHETRAVIDATIPVTIAARRGNLVHHSSVARWFERARSEPGSAERAISIVEGAPGSIVNRMIELLGLREIFPCHASREQALAGMSLADAELEGSVDELDDQSPNESPPRELWRRGCDV